MSEDQKTLFEGLVNDVLNEISDEVDEDLAFLVMGLILTETSTTRENGVLKIDFNDMEREAIFTSTKVRVNVADEKITVEVLELGKYEEGGDV